MCSRRSTRGSGVVKHVASRALVRLRMPATEKADGRAAATRRGVVHLSHRGYGWRAGQTTRGRSCAPTPARACIPPTSLPSPSPPPEASIPSASCASKAVAACRRRRPRHRYRHRHRPCLAPSGCRRPPGAPCCGEARPTACWLAARTPRGPSPPAEGVRCRRRRPLRRCPSRPVEPPRAGTGGYIKYYYVWSGSCMCMLKRISMLN